MTKIKFLAAAVFLSFVLTGAAKNFYVSQSGSGNQNGVDASNTLSSSWFSSTGSWGGGSNQISPGDTVHLVGTFTNQIAVQGSGTAGNPITILFEPNAKMTMAADTGIYLVNNNYLVIDGGQNGIIQNTDNGSLLGHQANVSGIVGFPTIGNITIQNLVMSNLFIHVPSASVDLDYGAGIYLSGVFSNIDVHGCHIYHNCRGILIGFNSGTSQNINIYSNSVNFAGWGIAVGCGNAGCVASGIKIANNQITGQSEWDSADNYYHEDGIYCFADGAGSYITNLVISGNIVGPDIGSHNTAALFLSSQSGAGVWNALVFNNILYTQVIYANEGLFYASVGVNNLQLINNTLDAAQTGSAGFNFESCNNITMYNNLFSDGQAAIRVVASNQQTSPSQLANCDYNDYYNLTGGATGWGGNAGGTWINWRSLGLDLHSGLANPYYVNQPKADFHLLKNNNIGTNLSSYGIAALAFDFDGNRRPATNYWDVGAYQFIPPTNSQTIVIGVTNAIPNPPKNVRVIGH